MFDITRAHTQFYIKEGSIIRCSSKENICAALSKVSVNELEILRNSTERGLIFKKNRSYYYANLEDFPPYDRVVIENVKAHICRVCRHLSAAPDELGGCAKSRGFSRNIELYDFILSGYETINFNNDVFMVIKCRNWDAAPKDKVRSTPISSEMKVLLSQFLWEDVEDYPQLLARMRLEKSRNNDRSW
ncbi:MAG: hypothetical protein IKF17_03445 [Clostridia bacterium]|nr:hypothetical protein [Clostridia bacterium]